MASIYSGLYSEPVDLEWAGWRSTTESLQRHGWSISAHQDMMRDTMELALEHPQLAARGYARMEHSFRDRFDNHRGGRTRAFANVLMGRDIRLRLSDPPDFRPVDCAPQWMEREMSIEAYAHFAPRMTLEAPFVLPEPDVDQLLQIILEKQQKAKTDYFRDLVRREGEILPAHTMSAQIISLKAA